MSALNIAFCLDKKIGDSLVGLLFANQLAHAGFNITICSTVLKPLKDWLPFKYQSVQKSPESVDDLIELSASYDAVVIYHYPELAQKLSSASHLHSKINNLMYFTPWGFKEKLPQAKPSHVKNPILDLMADLSGKIFAEKDHRPYEYISSLCAKLNISIQNLIVTSHVPTNKNLIHQKYSKRVLLHPTASIHKHSWSPYKFIKLARILRKNGFQPVFILHSSEMPQWNLYLNHEFEYVNLPLDELAEYIYESGFAICNASGIGHLCSFLNIPTLTINVNRSWAYKKWAPFFAKNTIVTHEWWMPNSLPACKTHRRTFISAQKVYKTFSNFYL